jgi:uncharacterized protein (DUF433 family)
MTKRAIDWSGCELVEVVPGKVSGAPLLKGTRLPADTVLENADGGVSAAEIAEVFDAPEEQVRAIVDYAARQRQARRLRRRAPRPA